MLRLTIVSGMANSVVIGGQTYGRFLVVQKLLLFSKTELACWHMLRLTTVGCYGLKSFFATAAVFVYRVVMNGGRN